MPKRILFSREKTEEELRQEFRLKGKYLDEFHEFRDYMKEYSRAERGEDEYREAARRGARMEKLITDRVSFLEKNLNAKKVSKTISKYLYLQEKYKQISITGKLRLTAKQKSQYVKTRREYVKFYRRNLELEELSLNPEKYERARERRAEGREKAKKEKKKPPTPQPFRLQFEYYRSMSPPMYFREQDRPENQMKPPTIGDWYA